MSEWLPLVVSVVSIAIAVGSSLHQMTTHERQIEMLEKKINGTPQAVERHNQEITALRDWKHDVATPMFARVQMAELEVTHLKEKLEWKDEIADLRMRLEQRR